jgi:transposase InsO family protein
MKMPYTSNDKVPRVRAAAVRMVRAGHSTRTVARHFGYSQSAVVKWCQKVGIVVGARIETRSSVPKTSPAALPKEVVARIIDARVHSKRCAEVVHAILKAEGVAVSLSSVKRTLSRYGLLKARSPWKRKRIYPPRPYATSPGMLVEMDTIHFVDKHQKRTYVYTALDVYSRYGFALLAPKIGCAPSVRFLKETRAYFPFPIQTIQTDNGPEFSKRFTDAVTRRGMYHRHNHPRSPNENGHLERFNRTIQEEIGRHGLCIFLAQDVATYLKHYNHERLHMSLNFKTPAQLLVK